MRHAQERSAVLSLLQRFDVRPPEPDRLLATLSGGNQQKALLAKWLQSRPALLLLHEPTQGVDIGSRKQILRIIAEVAAAGTVGRHRLRGIRGAREPLPPRARLPPRPGGSGIVGRSAHGSPHRRAMLPGMTSIGIRAGPSAGRRGRLCPLNSAAFSLAEAPVAILLKAFHSTR